MSRATLLLMFLLALLLVACDGGDNATAGATIVALQPTTADLLPTPTAAPSATPTPTTVSAPANAPTKPPVKIEVGTSAAAAATTTTPVATETPAGTATADPAQAQQFSWSGGYSFWPPPGYETQTNGGQTLFTSPEGIMSLAGGPQQASSAPPEQALGEALATINTSMGASLQAGAPSPVTVGSAPGVAADLSGSTPQGAMLGRLVSVQPAPGQLFYAFGLSPAQLWTGRDAARFQRLVNGVVFFPLGSQFGCPRSLDPTYGFSPDNPVRIGGGPAAPQREAAYLGALVSATGQPLPFQPAGSQAFGDRTLDVFTLVGAPAGQPAALYFDPNSYETLFAPVGFGCVGAIPVGAP